MISTYLGMRYTFTRDEEGFLTLKVDQTTYLDQLVKRFELDDLERYSGRNTPLPAATSASGLQQAVGGCSKPELKEWSEKFS